MSHTITSIQQAKKNIERVNVFLNEKYWISLTKQELIEASLHKGLQISSDEKLNLEKLSSFGKLFEKCVNLIMSRPRSEKEIFRYLLYKKGVEKDEANQIINKLIEKKYLDDNKFTEWFTQTRLDFGVHGLNKISAELAKKGIPPSIIKNVLNKFKSSEEFDSIQFEKAKSYLKKIENTVKFKDKYDLKAKLTRRMLSRGFDYELVKRVMGYE